MRAWWVGMLLAAGLQAGGTMSTHKATEKDLDAMVALSAAKRLEYQGYQPVFHRVAKEADAKQRLFLKDQLAHDDAFIVVHTTGGVVDGWVFARAVYAPPVYEPGGKALMIDDFCVAAPELWATAGKTLLQDAMVWGKNQGAVVVSVVCGPKDKPKRQLLADLGLDVATEWHVKALK